MTWPEAFVLITLVTAGLWATVVVPLAFLAFIGWALTWAFSDDDSEEGSA